jgi:drug/metabolite transporter (DMT)-like permease
METLKALALNGIVLAIVAHVLVGLSLVWDKVLLQRRETQNLLSYVFWLGAISIFGLILIVFGFKMPSWRIAGIAFAAGLLDLIASYFYYSALKNGEASDELAAMGGFAPIATALFALWLLKTPTGGNWAGFGLLTAGGFMMFFAERVPLRKMAPLIVIAATAFGLMNVLQKIAFNATNFVSGYVFFTLGTFAGSMALLFPPSWRKQVFEHSEEAPPKSKFWYMVNRFLAGVGSFLVVFAISRAHPSVVQAISGVRYVTIFIGAYLITRFRPTWFRENFGKRALFFKAAGTCLVTAGLVLVAMHGGGGDVQ